VSNLTENPEEGALNCVERLESGASPRTKYSPMLTAIVIALLVVAALGYAFSAGSSEGTILHRPYNNRYNDAAGARRDHLG